MTLLPEALAKQHGVPLSKVEEIALEHVDLGNGQHLFRFYDRPEDWKTNDAVTKLLATQPGFFKIETIKERVKGVKTLTELGDITHDWH